MSGEPQEFPVWRPGPDAPPPTGPRPALSIVVPTLGRPSLVRTLAAITTQILPGDEVLVECNDANDVGNSACQRGMEAATGTHVLFCDDDDVFLPGALDVMRRFAVEQPGAIGIFRRRFNAGPLQWAEPALRPGNIQRMGFVLPNVKGKLAPWGETSLDPARREELRVAGVRPWTDVHLIRETAELQGAPVIFCDVVVGHARPERNPLRRLRYRLRLRTRLRDLLGRAGA